MKIRETSGDLGGNGGRAPPFRPNFLKSLSSLGGKICQIILWRSPLDLPLPSKKSWISHWKRTCSSLTFVSSIRLRPNKQIYVFKNKVLQEHYKIQIAKTHSNDSNLDAEN